MPATAVQILRPMCRPPATSVVALALLAASAPGAAAAPGAEANEDDLYIVQTNAAGDNVHLIDPAGESLVAERLREAEQQLRRYLAGAGLRRHGARHVGLAVVFHGWELAASAAVE